MHACATGNSERVRQCLESLQGESADQRRALELELTATDDWAGSSPLHWAAFSGNACGRDAAQGGCKGKRTQPAGWLPADSSRCTVRQVGCARGARRRPGPAVREHPQPSQRPLHECAYEGRAEGAGHLLNRGAKLESPIVTKRAGSLPYSLLSSMAIWRWCRFCFDRARTCTLRRWTRARSSRAPAGCATPTSPRPLSSASAQIYPVSA